MGAAQRRAVWKMYATLVLGVCLVVLLCYPLPGELRRVCAYVARASGLTRIFSRIPSWKAGPCHRSLRVSQHRVDRALPSSAFHSVLPRSIL